MNDFYLLAMYVVVCIFAAVFVSKTMESKLIGIVIAINLFAMMANITAAACGSQCFAVDSIQTTQEPTK